MFHQPVSSSGSSGSRSSSTATSLTNVTLSRRFDCQFKSFLSSCTILSDQHSYNDNFCIATNNVDNVPFVHVNFCAHSAHLKSMFSWRFVQGTCIDVVSDYSSVVDSYIFVANDPMLPDGYYVFASHSQHDVALVSLASDSIHGALHFTSSMQFAIPVSCTSCHKVFHSAPNLVPTYFISISLWG